MIGKGAKWSKSEALPDWDRDLTNEDGQTIKWKSPRFMTKTEKRGAMRVKGILKKVQYNSSCANMGRRNGRRLRGMKMVLEVLVSRLLCKGSCTKGRNNKFI